MPTTMVKLPTAIKKPKEIAAKEWRRLQALHCYEYEARGQGFSVLAGVDEAGRGPLAGPVVAAACIIPQGVYLVGIDDSKKLSPKKRAELFEAIIANKEISYGVGIVSHEEIDRINIHQASLQAMLIAVSNLPLPPELLLVDGFSLPHATIPSQRIIKGDEKSHSIAAASVIAKESRDRLMLIEHDKDPRYGFDKHKGYGTPQHLSAISKHGPSAIQRLTFSIQATV